jgi:diguanylate cyclase (GGDEF)-like protein
MHRSRPLSTIMSRNPRYQLGLPIVTDTPRQDPHSPAQAGGAKALPKHGLLIDEYAMPASLRWQALVDAMERTRGGTFVHLPLFVLIGWLTGIAESHRAFFFGNVALLTVTALMRVAFTRYARGAAGSDASLERIRRFTWAFTGLYLLSGAHWGALAAAVSYWPSLESARIPIWLVCTGIAAAGTIILGLFQAVRIGYPAAVLLPPMCASLLSPSEGSIFAVAAAAMLWIYVFDASRGIRRDYWTGAVATKELEQRAAELERLSTTDALTEICNRRYFDVRLAEEWSRSIQTGQRIAVMVVDIDHFKSINDEYGHEVGDRCIVAAAEALRMGLRGQGDLLARYGGEEFAVLLPGVSEDAAIAAGEALRLRVADTLIEVKGKRVVMTCSVGVCSMTAGRNGRPDIAMRRADQALYIAKRAGRNRVVSFDESAVGNGIEESIRKALYR